MKCKEGSAEWALHQMMHGKKVCNPTLAAEKATRLGYDDVERFNTFWYIVGDAVAEGKANYGALSVSSWISAAHPYGWQIYKEPKPESQYKVGDWVEVEETATGEIEHHTVERVNTFCPVLPDYLVDDVWFNHNGMEITPLDCTFNHRRITRKLSPSEVIVRIGCLSGTVEDLSYAEDGRFWLIGKATERCPAGMHAILYDEMLDTPTSKLVEGLLKSQEESSD